MGELKTEKLVGSPEIMAFLGCKMSFLEACRKDAGLPFYKIGKKVRFRLSEVEAWVKQRRIEDLKHG